MAGLTPEETRVFLDQMWERFAHLAHERVADMEAYVGAVRSGTQTEEQRAAAQSAAHKLVGALGSYHRPGSEEAARVEQLLIGRADVDDLEPLVRQLRALITS